MSAGARHDHPDDDMDRRLRAAFAELADRSALHQISGQVPELSRVSAELPPAAPSRWTTPLLVAATVVAVLVTAGWILGPGRSADQVRPAVPTQTPTVTRATSTAPSQTAAEAERDGVVPAVAALPLSTRLQPVEPAFPKTLTTVTTTAGVWVISRPTFEPNPASDGQSCLGFGELGVTRVCSPQYGELLLLSADRSRIVKAYPFPASAPNWLLADIDRGVIYCGRGGAGAEWQSMVCRVDGSAGTWRVRVFPEDGVPGDHWITPRFFRSMPGDWKTDQTRVYSFDQPGWSSEGLGVHASGSGTTILSPTTLKVLRARNTP